MPDTVMRASMYKLTCKFIDSSATHIQVANGPKLQRTLFKGISLYPKIIFMNKESWWFKSFNNRQFFKYLFLNSLQECLSFKKNLNFMFFPNTANLGQFKKNNRLQGSRILRWRAPGQRTRVGRWPKRWLFVSWLNM